jgi:hypothetical protein
LTLAQSKHEEAAALKERTDQALREVALAYDQVDTGLQQYDAAIALQTASEAAFRSASDFLRARRRHVDRRDIGADRACHGAHRGGPRPRAVADQRSGTRLCDGRTDVKLRLCHLDTTVMTLHGTGLCLAYR